jgi:hypothetical protein
MLVLPAASDAEPLLEPGQASAFTLMPQEGRRFNTDGFRRDLLSLVEPP